MPQFHHGCTSIVRDRIVNGNINSLVIFLILSIWRNPAFKSFA